MSDGVKAQQTVESPALGGRLRLAGAALLWVSVGTVRARTRAAYRGLLRASVLYLPAIFALMALDRVARR